MWQLILKAADVYNDARDEDGWGYFNALKFARPLLDKDVIYLRYALSAQPKVIDRNRSRIERLLWQLFHAPIKVIPEKYTDYDEE